MSRLRKAGLLGGLTAAGVLAVVTVGKFEGEKTKAYRDIVGVWTICNGHTAGVREGDVATREECRRLLLKDLVEHEADLRACLRSPDSIPDNAYVAFLSLTINIGARAFCKSTLVKKLNAGDVAGACDELPKFNRAGGQVVAGLTRRRLEERALCHKGLPT